MPETRILEIGEKDWQRLLRYSPPLKFYRENPRVFLEEIEAIKNLQVEIEYDKTARKLVARVNKPLTPLQRLIIGAKVSEEVAGGNPLKLIDAGGKELTWDKTNWKALKKPTKVLPSLSPEDAKFLRKQLAYVENSTQLHYRSEELLKKFGKALIDYNENLHGKFPTADEIKLYLSKGGKTPSEILQEAQKIKEVLIKNKAPQSVINIFDNVIDDLTKAGATPKNAQTIQEVANELNKVSPELAKAGKSLLSKWWGGIIVGTAIVGSLLYKAFFGGKGEPKELKELDFDIPDTQEIARVNNLYRKWANYFASASAIAEAQYMNEVRNAQTQIALAQLFHQYAYNQYLSALNPDPVEVAKINTWVHMIAGLSESERLKLQKDLLKGHIIAQVRGMKFADPQQYLAFANVELPDLDSQIEQYIKEVDSFLKYKLKPIEKNLALYNDLTKYFFKKSVEYAIEIEDPANIYNYIILSNQKMKEKSEEYGVMLQNIDNLEKELQNPQLTKEKLENMGREIKALTGEKIEIGKEKIPEELKIRRRKGKEERKEEEIPEETLKELESLIKRR